ncbi:MAG: bi-domain-containing oxidoreductase [Deltaproteobacteria bacterium]|nr:bi-domain-containing oxidoreductase [Deltaproteobacteria bacterium]
MKQVLINYLNGDVSTEEVPIPFCKENGVLVANNCSVISPGTERGTVQLAKSNFFQKARQRPEQLKQVLQTLRQEGPIATFKKVMTRLDTLYPLGYCSSGTVIYVGQEVTGFKEGDSVVCAGEGIGSHAEVVWAPQFLCHLIPTNMKFEHAAFAPLIAIALQAVRQSECSIGDKVAVIGLGLLGLLTTQILNASGCHVIGIDIDEDRCRRAITAGAERVCLSSEKSVEQVQDFSGGYGVDAVLVMASSEDKAPLIQAGKYCREKGKVIVAGVIPTEFPRKDYWEKELTLKMARSFGPGYYDPEYTIHGHDYPFSYVRWTSGRNIQEAINLIQTGKLDPEPLITHRFRIEESKQAYESLSQSSSILGAIFEYERKVVLPPSSALNHKRIVSKKGEKPCIGWIGAGNFAQAYLLPLLKKNDEISLHTVSNSTSTSSHNAQRKFGFMKATCNVEDIMNSQEINGVFITSRHDSHAQLVENALNQNKHVFVEKPLALTKEELTGIVKTWEKHPAVLCVGYNRRYSPLSTWIKSHLKTVAGPLMLNYRINVGAMPDNHWLLDRKQGGGMTLAEVCHFVDLLIYFSSSKPTSVYAKTFGATPTEKRTNLLATICFENGSVGSISYIINSDASFPRERIEIFGRNSVAVIDNFKQASITHGGKSRRMRKWARNMGYEEEIKLVLKTFRENGPLPIPLEDLVATSLTTFKIEEALRENKPIPINLDEILNPAIL